MRCQEFLDRYSAYRDGGDPALVGEMEAHLGVCPDCREHDAAVRFGVDLLRSGLIAPSPGFQRRLEERLAEVDAPAERSPMHRAAPLATAALVLLFAGLAVVAARRHAIVTMVAAETAPPVARPRANAGIPFVAFVPSR